MKTVIDAVNEFKGEWTDTHGTCLWYYSGSDAYIFGNSSHSDHTVCTRDEFNQCVDDMATNYGTSETYANYKVNFEMINDDMKAAIDWSKAPEDCVGAVESHDDNHPYSFGHFVANCDGFDGYIYCHADEAYPCMDNFTFIPRPEVKPVTPIFEIGAKVTLVEDTNLYSCHYDVVYDLSAGDTVTVVGHGVRPDNDAPLITITNGKGFATLNPDYIASPIEPEEKTLNDMIEQLTNEGIVTYDPIMLRILIAKFKANKISFVTFTGK